MHLMPDDDPAPEDAINDDTLDFIFNHIKGASADHHQIWTALDTKMVSVFGVGSAIVGLAGFSVARGPTSPSSSVAALLSAGLVAYAVAAVAALIHLWPKEGRHTTYGATLWLEAWARPVKQIKHGLVTDMTAAAKANKAALGKKALTLRIAVAAAAMETFLVGVAFVVALASPTAPLAPGCPASASNSARGAVEAPMAPSGHFPAQRHSPPRNSAASPCR